jgi:hypothetical protein
VHGAEDRRPWRLVGLLLGSGGDTVSVSGLWGCSRNVPDSGNGLCRRRAEKGSALVTPDS